MQQADEDQETIVSFFSCQGTLGERLRLQERGWPG